MNRRKFIQSACLAPALGWAQKAHPVLKVSLNAYSFNQRLNDSIQGRPGGITLLELVDWTAHNKFDAIDATGYYFPGYPEVPNDSYIATLKKKAADLGLAISGAGVRNNFTPADESIRAAGVKLVKAWIEVAAKLGAPVIRVFADTQGGKKWQDVAPGLAREQVQQYIAAALRECADEGKKHGVRIGVQNHADYLQTGEQLLSLIKAVGSDWCGPILDIGSFRTKDPYADIAMVAPHAINWQIKQSLTGEAGGEQTDLIRLMKIVRQSGYSGYLPIETLSPRGKPYDPFAVVPVFLRQVREALAQTSAFTLPRYRQHRTAAAG